MVTLTGTIGSSYFGHLANHDSWTRRENEISGVQLVLSSSALEESVMNTCYGRVQSKGPLNMGEVLCLQKYLEASLSFPDSFIIKTTQLLVVTHFEKFVVENKHKK